MLDPDDMVLLRTIQQRISRAFQPSLHQQLLAQPLNARSFARLGHLWHVAKMVDGDLVKLGQPGLDSWLLESHGFIDWMIEQTREAEDELRKQIHELQSSVGTAQDLKDLSVTNLETDARFKALVGQESQFLPGFVCKRAASARRMV